MLTYTILAALWLTAPIFGFWPPVRRNSDRTANTMLSISMREPSFYVRTGQPYAAVFAQELAEWWIKWAVALPLGALALPWIDAAPEIKVVLAIAAPVFAYLWAVPFKRQIELLGHAVEIVVASRTMNRDAYIAAEAERMARGYDGMFAASGTASALRARLGMARVLVAILRIPIRREERP